MTPTPYAIGTRVRVRRDPIHGPGPWPSEPTGTIIEAPKHLPHDLAGTPFTLATTLQGPEVQYWVAFDEGQFDAEGDGPYNGSQVLSQYIEVLAAQES